MIARSLARLVACRSGTTAVEYGILAGFIAVALIIAATALGSTLGNGVFQVIADYFNERADG